MKAGLGKSDVRELSRRMGLPTWDKPALACLASRFPYGMTITAARLRQVNTAEDFLRRELGLRQLRVRHHGDVARLEVEPEDMAQFMEEDTRQRVVTAMKDQGTRMRPWTWRDSVAGV